LNLKELLFQLLLVVDHIKLYILDQRTSKLFQYVQVPVHLIIGNHPVQVESKS